MKLSPFVVGITFIVSCSFQLGFGDGTRSDLGSITDLAADGTSFYYFEVDKGLESSAWIPDTRVMMNDGKTTHVISEKLFIYPSELNIDKEYLYFVALSTDCIGRIACDYQDIYKMSKKNGDIKVLTKALKSSVHISVDADLLYISESSGNIWQINKHDGSKNLVIKANEIVMDMIAKDGKIYWIEEKSDRNSAILSLDGTQGPKILAEHLQIPYDLTIQNGRIYWNEIQTGHIQDNFAEFTAIKSFDDKPVTIMTFENTSPISTSFGRPNYGPYLVFDNYLFLINNTNDDSVIHMINMHNSTKYDVGTISNYDAKYLRTDGTSLFVIGKNDQGFVIDKHPLPIVVPEFPTAMLLVLPLAFTSVFILKRFWRN